MRKTLLLLATVTLAGCGYSYSPYGYNRNAYNPYSYNPYVGTVGVLGGAYGSSFSQAAASACSSYAARYGAVRVTSVRRTDNNRMRVRGLVSRGFGSDDWGCTFRADGRISDFDL